ncbi:Serine/threonine-protein kinase TAO1 [Fasciola gigantica]|uniref:non-specific serine/threonine protein kinase n=1 Tax=Fasciola gigantica TaxID=46835 RepID=A0A504YRR0_FASGI|nr:Serine/threonine-protein kinase TAO1 [Fasciola gigantica]
MKDQKPRLVMEYCTGSLADILEVNKLPLRQSEIACIVREVLNGLEYLHSKQRIRRDIKAANILLTDSGGVEIGDFCSTSLRSAAASFAAQENQISQKCKKILYEIPVRPIRHHRLSAADLVRHGIELQNTALNSQTAYLAVTENHLYANIDPVPLHTNGNESRIYHSFVIDDRPPRVDSIGAAATPAKALDDVTPTHYANEAITIFEAS